ncbi:MAG: BrnA antitoxin family protein [Pseudaminobacter sp.]|nr:BrnA antitoxin family protein [Pseudaminobacter sp.]
MTGSTRKYEPGHGYTKEEWDAVDSPPATPEQLAQAKPFAKVFPELAENMRKNLGGRPPLENPKQAVSIRLDQDVLAKFKATGPGWQSRINDVLKQAKV